MLAAPDDGNRVLSLSDDHGISSLDALGVVVLVLGWAIPMAAALDGRSRARARLGGAGIGLVLMACVAGGTILVTTIAADSGMWWLLGVALLAGAQAVFFAAAR